MAMLESAEMEAVLEVWAAFWAAAQLAVAREAWAVAEAWVAMEEGMGVGGRSRSSCICSVDSFPPGC